MLRKSHELSQIVSSLSKNSEHIHKGNKGKINQIQSYILRFNFPTVTQ